MAFIMSRKVAGLLCCCLLSVLICLVIAAVVAGTTASSEGTEQAVLVGKASEHTEQCQRLPVCNAEFALDLYKRQTSPADHNLFMSPLSISVALAMTYLGAREQTKSQMRNTLHFANLVDDHLHEAFTDIQSALNKPHQPYKLYMANRLFGEKSYTFLDEFLSAERKHYGAELEPVNFRGDSNGAATIINRWVAEQTNNKITEIVSSDALNALTRLVLVNAVYFKGDWVKKFDGNETRDADFHVMPQKSVNVKMMHAKMKLYYGWNSELHCQAIELPYSGESLSMFVLLPDPTATSLSEVEKKLTASDLVNVREKFDMSLVKVIVWLPRFSLDEKLDLVNMLAAMGMVDLFKAGAADLSGIDGSKELYVSNVLHRAVVEVNEEGTEAAAATAVVIMMRSMPIDKPPVFHADHPFIFFVQEKSTKSILFLGRLVKPASVSTESDH